MCSAMQAALSSTMRQASNCAHSKQLKSAAALVSSALQGHCYKMIIESLSITSKEVVPCYWCVCEHKPAFDVGPAPSRWPVSKLQAPSGSIGVTPASQTSRSRCTSDNDISLMPYPATLRKQLSVTARYAGCQCPLTTATCNPWQMVHGKKHAHAVSTREKQDPWRQDCNQKSEIRQQTLATSGTICGGKFETFPEE